MRGSKVYSILGNGRMYTSFLLVRRSIAVQQHTVAMNNGTKDDSYISVRLAVKLTFRILRKVTRTVDGRRTPRMTAPLSDAMLIPLGVDGHDDT